MGVVRAAFVLICLFNCFYTLDVEHAAVVTTLGRPEAVIEAGPHFKIPFVQKVKKLDTTIKGMTIGYDEATNESKSEFYSFVRSLDAAKKSLNNNENTLILDKNSPIAQIFYNK